MQLKRFILAASTVRTISLFWFQKEEKKLTGKKGLTLCQTRLMTKSKRLVTTCANEAM